jgi:hypothetical protein
MRFLYTYVDRIDVYVKKLDSNSIRSLAIPRFQIVVNQGEGQKNVESGSQDSVEKT